MTLGFSTKWPDRMGELAGQPNYFTNKIAKGIWKSHGKEFSEFISNRSKEENERFDRINPFGKLSVYQSEQLFPKLTTIREDKHNRWREGMDIHFVINNRTKDRFQFAPVVKCAGKQDIIIHTSDVRVLEGNIWRIVEGDKLNKLAINDGFNDMDCFMRYFENSRHTPLRLIHWTDLKY